MKGQDRTAGRTRHFTLVELLVVIAIISILAGLLMPALENAMLSARQIKCASQLKQIGMLWAMYGNDWDDYIGDYRQCGLYYWGGKRVSGAWGAPGPKGRLLGPYCETYDLFRCPDDAGRGNTPIYVYTGNSYAVGNSNNRGVLALYDNGNGHYNNGHFSAVTVPSKTFLSQDATYETNSYWHVDDVSNVVMVDLHCEIIPRHLFETQVAFNPPGYSRGWVPWSPRSEW